MKSQLANTLLPLTLDPQMCFLTGALGFMSLEPLQTSLSHRFINMGIAEQNMIGVSAGLAKAGWKPWVYSIAPFCYARPFEQIRNDICFHQLPVKLIGNGGGYTYGVMGPTHHALEDYGILLTLPHMKVLIPAVPQDLTTLLPRMHDAEHPTYLRLGRARALLNFPTMPYAPWRCLLTGRADHVVICVGTMAAIVYPLLQDIPVALRPQLWVICELPLDPHTLPAKLYQMLAYHPHITIIEDHVVQGSFGSALAHWALAQGFSFKTFQHRYAKGYPSGRYGSELFHHLESGLDPQSLQELLCHSLVPS
jgi:transketolase